MATREPSILVRVMVANLRSLCVHVYMREGGGGDREGFPCNEKQRCELHALLSSL